MEIQNKKDSLSIKLSTSSILYPIAAGFLCFLLSHYSLRFNLETIQISIPWALLFPIIISLAYGPRGALITAFSGGALFPFVLWAGDGWANVLNVMHLTLLFVLLGWTSTHKKDSQSAGKTYIRLFAAIFTYSCVISFNYAFVFNPILSFNPPFWLKKAATSIDPHIMLSFAVKDSINILLLTVLAETILCLPQIRKGMRLGVFPYMRKNTRVFLYSFLTAGGIWLVFFLLDYLLINQEQILKHDYLSLSLLIMFWSGGIVSRILIQFIQQRLQAEQQRKITLEEKEILLRELYHRTKNNMQMISAYLKLQQNYSDSKQLKDQLQSTINRIESMSLVHKKLYQAHNLSSLSLKIYVEELAQLIIQNYTIDTKKIHVFTDIDDIQVVIDIAIPVGLILNELLSNSFKHAFPEGAGSITIAIRKSDNNILSLNYIDTGNGLPDNFDVRASETLGLQTVVGIAESQLSGSIRFSSENGFHCVVMFDPSKYVKRI